MLNSFSPTGVSNAFAAEAFPDLLPRLTIYLRSAFHHFQPEQQEDALQETIAGAFVAFARLCQRGRSQFGVPRSLARYAIAHWFAGHRVGSPLNGTDVLSAHARRRHSITIEQLNHVERSRGTWHSSLVADRQTPIPEQVWFRIDFPVWLAQLTSRNRQIALALAQGDTAREVSQRFAVSPGRVSQLRSEFRESWRQFHGEPSSPNESARAASTETRLGRPVS